MQGFALLGILLVNVLGIMALALFDMAGRNGRNPWIAFPGELGFGFSRFALAPACASGLLLLLLRPIGAVLRGIQAPVGWMAQTNYLARTLICTSPFFGFGFRLYGKVGASQVVPIAPAIFAVQVAISRAWLRKFRFGPMEWRWRTATCWQSLPLRAPAPA